MKKIYIAGKVTGLPLQETKAKFALASEELKHKGFDPVCVNVDGFLQIQIEALS